MKKFFLLYSENPEVLQLLTFFTVSFSFSLLGTLFTIVRTFNKRKTRRKKICIDKNLYSLLEVLLSCLFIAVFVLSILDRLDRDYVKVMAVSSVLGISREHIADKISEEDFWQKLIKVIFTDGVAKIKSIGDLFNKKDKK